MESANVIGVSVSTLGAANQIERIIQWSLDRRSSYVCVANVHMLMEGHWDAGFRTVLGEADLVVPDGMPLVWMVRLAGEKKQERMAGLDILAASCSVAQERGVSLFLLGATEEVLVKIVARLAETYPALVVAGYESLPFRASTEEEDQQLVDRINESGAGLIFVALGCPKQERWMHAHRGAIRGTMIGLGGAFNVYAGLQKRAPAWIRSAGLEWLFRLAQEPRRLWRRYLVTNMGFLWEVSKQLLLMARGRG